MFSKIPLSGSRYVGVGFSKTGTTTLGKCFEILNLGPVGTPEVIHNRFQNSLRDENIRNNRFNEYPWRLMVEDVFYQQSYELALLIASNFRSLVDRPWSVPAVYELIDKLYPQSKFIMTHRDPQSWWNSVDRWLNVTHKGNDERLKRYLMHLGVETLDKDLFVDAYLRHNENVQKYFKNRQDDLLVIDFEKGEGWERLCNFLDCPVPNLPFPHANKQMY